MEDDGQYVENLEEIIKNIIQFNEDIKAVDSELRQLLSKFRHWYCIEKEGKILFAPNKYIIFKDDDEEKYIHLISNNLYGDAELPILHQYFIKSYDIKLLGKLKSFFDKFEKEPNILTLKLTDKKGGIWVPKKEGLG